MPLPKRFLRKPETASPDLSCREAARRMALANVGCLVVVDGDVLVGIVTDRDLALGVLDARLDPQATPISTMMRAPVLRIRESESLADASLLMRQYAVRRLPIVDTEGSLIGILTADDLMLLLGKEVGALAETIHRGLSKESRPSLDDTSIFGKE